MLSPERLRPSCIRYISIMWVEMVIHVVFEPGD
uniref:Uncharacterized protein n=1 Tax=Setaria italica TaxID=4555 RepID=K4ANY6_SETIT